MPQQSQTQNTLLLALIMIVGIAAGYIYYGQLTSPYVPPAILPAGKAEFDALKNLSADFGILSNQRIQALKIYGEVPVNPGVTGKNDPFSPF